MYSKYFSCAIGDSRRMGPILWLLAVLSTWGAVSTSTPNATAAENVLLIIADDYGVSSHGFYGYASSSPPTPNLDTLAAQGAVFGNAWVTPMCSPTRARILTGRYGFRTGVGSPGALAPISLDEYTVAQALKTLGYSTGCFGKWHLAGPDNGEDDNPNLMGFDRFAGSRANLGDYFNWSKVVDGVTNPCTNYSTTELTDDAIAWINQQGSQPWFCWLAYHAPHGPFHKPPNDLHSYDDLPDTGANTVSYYEAMVEAMDTEIGRLFSSIDPNVLDNTNIVFIGDNGTPGQAIVPPAERGRAKGTVYQGGVWVPWFMKGPSIPQTDTMITALVESVDLFSTIIELAGGTAESMIPPGVILDSKSVMPLLVSPGSGSVRDYAMTEIFRTNPRDSDGKAIRNDEYKLIRFDSGGERFYHLASDTWEQNDLLAGTLNTTQQDNYYRLNTWLDQLLSGDIGEPPGLASDPSPADAVTYVPRVVVLSWTPGEFANTHDVYFGNSFEDVNAATTASDEYKGNQSETSYALERLDFGQTYFWRVDEVNAPPDLTIFKGNIWSFTVEPFAYPLVSENITATASSSNAIDEGPENTINGSGLDADDLHSAKKTDMWLSRAIGPHPIWIQYEFDTVYILHEMSVWNYNSPVEPVIGWGIRDATIEYSADGNDWTELSGVPEFAQGAGAAGYAANTTVDLGGVAAKYIKINANNNWGGILAQYGLSEVRFFYIPVREESLIQLLGQ